MHSSRGICYFHCISSKERDLCYDTNQYVLNIFMWYLSYMCCISSYWVKSWTMVFRRFVSFCTTLYYTTPYCNLVCCIVLCCIVLFCIVLCCIVLCCVGFCCIALFFLVTPSSDSVYASGRLVVHIRYKISATQYPTLTPNSYHCPTWQDQGSLFTSHTIWKSYLTKNAIHAEYCHNIHWLQ